MAEMTKKIELTVLKIRLRLIFAINSYLLTGWE